MEAEKGVYRGTIPDVQTSRTARQKHIYNQK